MACMFPVCITTLPSCTHYVTYTPPCPRSLEPGRKTPKGKQFPCTGGVLGGRTLGGEKGTNSRSGPQMRPCVRNCGPRPLWQGPGGTPQQQCAPTPAMAGVWPPWRVQCSVIPPPSARRGGGVGCLRNVWAVALNPWSPWRHLKRALGTPLKRPCAQGARPRWRARVKLGTGMHLKTPGSGCFPPRTKCQKGGWAGLAA